MIGFQQITRAEYEARKGIRISSINKGWKSLAHYRQYELNHPELDEEEKGALWLGTLIHKAILEPDLYETSTVVLPVDAPARPQERFRNAKRPSPETVAAFEFWDDFKRNNHGRTIISDDEKNKVNAIVENVHSHKRASEILAACKRRELAVFTRHNATGLLLKSLYDLVTDDDSLIADIKTTFNSDPDKWKRSILDRGYHRQGAYYVDHFTRLEKPKPDFAHICIDVADPPYVVCVRGMDETTMEIGHAEYNSRLHQIANCVKSGKWPGYPDEETGLPDWYLRRM